MRASLHNIYSRPGWRLPKWQALRGFLDLDAYLIPVALATRGGGPSRPWWGAPASTPTVPPARPAMRVRFVVASDDRDSRPYARDVYRPERQARLRAVQRITRQLSVR